MTNCAVDGDRYVRRTHFWRRGHVAEKLGMRRQSLVCKILAIGAAIGRLQMRTTVIGDSLIIGDTPRPVVVPLTRWP